MSSKSKGGRRKHRARDAIGGTLGRAASYFAGQAARLGADAPQASQPRDPESEDRTRQLLREVAPGGNGGQGAMRRMLLALGEVSIPSSRFPGADASMVTRTTMKAWNDATVGMEAPIRAGAALEMAVKMAQQGEVYMVRAMLKRARLDVTDPEILDLIDTELARFTQ